MLCGSKTAARGLPSLAHALLEVWPGPTHGAAVGTPRKKVRPLDADPAIDRAYEPGDEAKSDDPWQDPGGPEPANG